MTTCPNCNQPFEPRSLELFGKEVFRAIYCDACADAMSEAYDRESADRERQAIADRNEKRWFGICPELYRNTDQTRLPQKALIRALAWRFGPLGMVLHGPTGIGKTRVLYCVLRRLFDEGWKIRVHTGAEFRRSYAAAAMRNEAELWIEKTGGVDVLAIDDLGQTKMTDSSEEALLDVLELRSRTQKPTLFTTQYTGDQLVSQFTRPERGEAVGRRMRDFCQAIYVGAKVTSNH